VSFFAIQPEGLWSLGEERERVKRRCLHLPLVIFGELPSSEKTEKQNEKLKLLTAKAGDRQLTHYEEELSAKGWG
jgi:hypothetical protein